MKVVVLAQTCIAGESPEILTLKRIAELDHTCGLNIQ